MKRLVVAVLITACSTPYQSHGWWRGGYEETRMSDRQWLVRVGVNGYTSESTAIEYAHRRAGELCPAGYDVKDSKTGEWRRGPEATLIVECRVH